MGRPRKKEEDKKPQSRRTGRYYAYQIEPDPKPIIQRPKAEYDNENTFEKYEKLTLDQLYSR
jgi:hypothetical protein